MINVTFGLVQLNCGVHLESLKIIYLVESQKGC